MGIITLKCRNCGDYLLYNDSRQKTICSSCGAENILTQDTGNTDAQNIVNILVKQKDRKLRRSCLVLCVTILIGWAILFFTPFSLFFSELISLDGLAVMTISSFVSPDFQLSSNIYLLFSLISLFLAPLSVIAMLLLGYYKVQRHKAVFAVETALMSLNALILMCLAIFLSISLHSYSYLLVFFLGVVSIITVSFILLLMFNARLYINTTNPQGEPQWKKRYVGLLVFAPFCVVLFVSSLIMGIRFAFTISSLCLPTFLLSAASLTVGIFLLTRLPLYKRKSRGLREG